jgi:hypothetical protein
MCFRIPHIVTGISINEVKRLIVGGGFSDDSHGRETLQLDNLTESQEMFLVKNQLYSSPEKRHIALPSG